MIVTPEGQQLILEGKLTKGNMLPGRLVFNYVRFSDDSIELFISLCNFKGNPLIIWDSMDLEPGESVTVEGLELASDFVLE